MVSGLGLGVCRVSVHNQAWYALRGSQIKWLRWYDGPGRRGRLGRRDTRFQGFRGLWA